MCTNLHMILGESPHWPRRGKPPGQSVARRSVVEQEVHKDALGRPFSGRIRGEMAVFGGSERACGDQGYEFTARCGSGHVPQHALRGTGPVARSSDEVALAQVSDGHPMGPKSEKYREPCAHPHGSASSDGSGRSPTKPWTRGHEAAITASVRHEGLCSALYLHIGHAEARPRSEPGDCYPDLIQDVTVPLDETPSGWGKPPTGRSY